MLEKECQAVILGVMDYAEADKIVTLFSMEHGKVRGLARGAKRSRKRFGGALEPFARLQLQLKLKEGLSTLVGADIIGIYPHIRQDLQKIAHAAYACELIDQLVAEGEQNLRLFRLLTAYLAHLDGAAADQCNRRFFEVNLLKVLGYQPELAHCHSCNVDLTSLAQLRFSPATMALLCCSCGKTGHPVSGDTVAVLARAMKCGRFGQISMSATALAEAGVILDSAICCHLTRPLKSIAFMEQIAR